MDKKDIANREDIDHLVRQFYLQAIPDPVIGHFFTEVMQLDLASHLPRIANFWEAMLLKNPVYSGTPMQVHISLNDKSPMTAEHFARWVELWSATVDSLFNGPVAALAKDRAKLVARSIALGIGQPVANGRP